MTSHADVAPTVLSHFGVATPSHYAGATIGNNAVNLSMDSLSGSGSGLISHLTFDGHTNAGLAGSGGTVDRNIGYTSGKFGEAVTVENYGDGSVSLDDDIAAMAGANGDFSVSMWIKYDSFTGDPSFFSNKDWDNGSNTGINLALNDDDALYLNSKGETGDRGDINAPSSLEAGEWQNVVMNVDRDGELTLFVDGVLVGTRADTTLGSLDGTFDFVFLNDGTGDYGSGSFSGLAIDEFAAWNRLLTLDEVSALSQRNLGFASVPEPGSFAVLAVAGLFLARRRRKE